MRPLKEVHGIDVDSTVIKDDGSINYPLLKILRDRQQADPDGVVYVINTARTLKQTLIKYKQEVFQFGVMGESVTSAEQVRIILKKFQVQLICNVEKEVVEQGINLNGVLTKGDYYLMNKSDDYQPGDYYRNVMRPFEQRWDRYIDHLINLEDDALLEWKISVSNGDGYMSTLEMLVGQDDFPDYIQSENIQDPLVSVQPLDMKANHKPLDALVSSEEILYANDNKKYLQLQRFAESIYGDESVHLVMWDDSVASDRRENEDSELGEVPDDSGIVRMFVDISAGTVSLYRQDHLPVEHDHVIQLGDELTVNFNQARDLGEEGEGLLNPIVTQLIEGSDYVFSGQYEGFRFISTDSVSFSVTLSHPQYEEINEEGGVGEEKGEEGALLSQGQPPLHLDFIYHGDTETWDVEPSLAATDEEIEPRSRLLQENIDRYSQRQAGYPINESTPMSNLNIVTSLQGIRLEKTFLERNSSLLIKASFGAFCVAGLVVAGIATGGIFPAVAGIVAAANFGATTTTATAAVYGSSSFFGTFSGGFGVGKLWNKFFGKKEDNPNGFSSLPEPPSLDPGQVVGDGSGVVEEKEHEDELEVKGEPTLDSNVQLVEKALREMSVADQNTFLEEMIPGHRAPEVTNGESDFDNDDLHSSAQFVTQEIYNMMGESTKDAHAFSGFFTSLVETSKESKQASDLLSNSSMFCERNSITDHSSTTLVSDRERHSNYTLAK